MNTQPDIEGDTEPVEPSATEVAEVEALKAEVLKYKDAALRALADLDNSRKRLTREKEDAIRFANASLLENLLPILDNFELGMVAARNTPGAANVAMGFEMVRKQLEDFLRSQGVETIDATGQPFDPNLHDAVAHEASETVPEEHVISQMRRGFKLRDRLIRPATVVVSKGPETE